MRVLDTNACSTLNIGVPGALYIKIRQSMRCSVGVLRVTGGNPGIRPFAACLAPIGMCRPEKLAPLAETLYNAPMGA